MVGIKALGTDLKEIKSQLTSMQQTQEEFVTLPQAAEFLKISKSKIYKMTMSREIKFFKPSGKKILFKKSDLVKFIESGEVRSLTAA